MDDLRLPEFEVYDGDDARTHGRRSAQSGRVEFITRGDRRRVWASEQKRAIALESLDPSTTPTDVARRYASAAAYFTRGGGSCGRASLGLRRAV